MKEGGREGKIRGTAGLFQFSPLLLPLTSQFPNIKASIRQTCLDSPFLCTPTHPPFPFLFPPFHSSISSLSLTYFFPDICLGYNTLLFPSFIIQFLFTLHLHFLLVSLHLIVLSTPSFLFTCCFILDSLVSLETIFLVHKKNFT